MKNIILLTLACSTNLFARVAEETTTAWFNETLEKCTTSSTGSGVLKATATRWTPGGESDMSAYSEGKIVVDTSGGELTMKPYTTGGDGYATTTENKSDYNKLTTVTMNAVKMTAFLDGEEWQYVESAPLAGLAMRRHKEGDCTFIGWVTTRDSSKVKGRWLELSAAGVEATSGATYNVKVEQDFRCVPTRIRYFVNNMVLRDSIGNEWFSIRQGSLAPSAGAGSKRIAQFGFAGSGSVGAIQATNTSLPTPRGTVTAPRIAVPKVGVELNAADFGIEGVELGANVAYEWYLIDAAGMRVPESTRGTAATYALSEGDYGHWVALDVSDENGFIGTGKFWFSDLPVVYVEAMDAKGFVETFDETAVEGRIYYWANEDDAFTPTNVAAGTDLGPVREAVGKLFLEDVKTAWPTSKKEDHKAIIYITGNAKYKKQYDSDGTLDGDEVIMSKIHVRGNSTAGADKKPYKIKLGKKADLFGLGGGEKNKHWTLLANCFDESLMRNKLSYDLSGELGLVSMKCEWVDMVMNGQYVGNYLVCQHIRVAPERINIYDWSTAYEKIAAAAQEANPELSDDDVGEIETLLEEEQGWMGNGHFSYLGTNYTVVAKGTAGSDGQGGFTVVWKKYSNDISGGYVFELDHKKIGPLATAPAASAFIQQHAHEGAMDFYLAMNTPEFCFTNPDVSNYVWNTWFDLGDAWTRWNGYNAKGRHYSELCDFDSMVNYWLSIFVPGNNDARALSRYCYKDVGGKLVWGPAWDYDYGLGSLQIRSNSPAVTNEYGETFYAPIVTDAWIPGSGTENVMGSWNSDPYFMLRLRERYRFIRPYMQSMVEDGGLIDQYKTLLAASARANDLRWNNRIGFFGNAEEKGDADVVKEFLTRHFAWLDTQFSINGSFGAALPLLTKTAAWSSARYNRATALAPTFDSAVPVADSPETDLADVEFPVRKASVSVSVAVPTANATQLDIYVNGLLSQNVPVSGSAAQVSVPTTAFVPGGTRNLMEFVAKDSTGKPLARNLALVQVPRAAGFYLLFR